MRGLTRRAVRRYKPRNLARKKVTVVPRLPGTTTKRSSAGSRGQRK